MIRDTIPDDKEPLLKIIREGGQFDAVGLAHVQAALDAHFTEEGNSLWLTADDGEPIGVAYCNLEPVTSGTWNLLMLWVREDRQSAGVGRSLVSETESRLRTNGARLFMVETSALPEFESARAFYSKCGFTHEATIQNFFAEGDHKLIYTKSLKAG